MNFWLKRGKRALGRTDWFREVLEQRDIQPCISPRSKRKIQISYDRAVYKYRHKIENMFGKLTKRA